MDVKNTERYWEKILACRLSLMESLSPENSLTFLNAVDKLIRKFGDKALKKITVGYTIRFFTTIIFPKLKAPKKLEKKIKVNLRNIVELLLVKLQYSLVAKAQLLFFANHLSFSSEEAVIYLKNTQVIYDQIAFTRGMVGVSRTQDIDKKEIEDNNGMKIVVEEVISDMLTAVENQLEEAMGPFETFGMMLPASWVPKVENF